MLGLFLSFNVICIYRHAVLPDELSICGDGFHVTVQASELPLSSVIN